MSNIGWEMCVFISQSANLILFCILSCALKDFHFFGLRPRASPVMVGPWWHRWSSLCSQLCSAPFPPLQMSAPTASCLELKVTHIRHIWKVRMRRMFRGRCCLPALRSIQSSPPWAQVHGSAHEMWHISGKFRRKTPWVYLRPDGAKHVMSCGLLACRPLPRGLREGEPARMFYILRHPVACSPADSDRQT